MYAENELLIKELVGAIRKFVRAVSIDTYKMSREYGLTGPQCVVIRTLAAEGSLSSASLSRRLYVTPANITGIIDRLENKGLVERNRKDGDRRVALITLTQSGNKMSKTLPDPIETKFIAELGDLGPEHIRILSLVINQILHLIDAKGIDVDFLDLHMGHGCAQNNEKQPQLLSFNMFMKHKNDTMNLSDRSQWLDKVYSARNNTELAEGYDAWAQDYEQDVLSFGYKIPAIMSGLIGRYLPSGTGRILDAGAGTGILGESLAVMGYKDLIGIDLSAGMLEVARKKDVYRNLLQMTLGQKLDFADNTFSATVSMGVFTEGHAPAESFDELIRITESQGYIIFSVRADVFLSQGFKKKLSSLEKKGEWRLVEQTDPFQALPLGDSELYNLIFVYRVS